MAKKGKKSEEMTIADAVDNLSGMAELDAPIDKEGEVGVKGKLKNLKTLKAEEKEELLSTVKGTFKTVHKYLKHVYTKEKGQLQSREMQRGIKAIMVLADEAADKLTAYTTLFKYTYEEGQVLEIKEYKDLQKFYSDKILKRFQEVLEKEAAWQEEWAETEEEEIDIERQGLKDLDMVKRDKEYELLYIRHDDGKPLFNRNLLRHIKLVSDFDEVILGFEGEDPLLQVNVLLDHEAQAVAEEIREIAKEELGDFYADAFHNKEIPIVGKVLKVTMSLMLACNPRNLHENTAGKMCTRYLKDFHRFLREILASSDYRELIGHTAAETDQFTRAVVGLIHAVSYAFFTHSGKKQEMLDYLQGLIKRSYEEGPPPTKEGIDTTALMSEIFDLHDTVTTMLKKYPSGPLFKVLDIFQERNEEEGFDPIRQGNAPYYLYTFSSAPFDAQCLKMPCPTLHSHINKAEVIDEYKGFLRHLGAKPELKRHLHFNLQDRTSWEESARCLALEHLQNQAEFSEQIVFVTLSKKSDFYFQAEDYLSIDSAKNFMKITEDQIASAESCGFYFPKELSRKELLDYTKKVLPIIHTHFFKKKAKLSRKERLDFIEIFYLFFTLKIMEMVEPGTFTFSCKDGVDIGATASGAFFALTKLLGKEGSWTKEEQDHFLWILMGPALVVRERLVDYQRFSRMASALSILTAILSKDRDKVVKALQPHFSAKFFQKFKNEF